MMIPHPFVPVFSEDFDLKVCRHFNAEDFQTLLQIYEEAFPVEERRTAEQLKQEAENPLAHVGLLSYQGEKAGIFIFWELDDFFYIGHFAIAKEKRARKIGEKFLSEFLPQLPKPAIWEVEKPENPIAQGRIAFYQRLGARLLECDYIQPAYQPDKCEGVPLYLMEFLPESIGPKGALLPERYEEVVRAIHGQVYGI